jgi:hypothetical protein
MAKDLVVNCCVTRDMIEAGERLTRLLDETGWSVPAALWYRFNRNDVERWQLTFASHTVAEEGPRASYGRMQDILRRGNMEEPVPSLTDVTLLKLSDPIIQGLAEVVTTEPRAIEGHWRPSAAVGSTMLGDAYVYRMAPGVREAGEAPPAREEARV